MTNLMEQYKTILLSKNYQKLEENELDNILEAITDIEEAEKLLDEWIESLNEVGAEQYLKNVKDRFAARKTGSDAAKKYLGKKEVSKHITKAGEFAKKHATKAGEFTKKHASKVGEFAKKHATKVAGAISKNPGKTAAAVAGAVAVGAAALKIKKMRDKKKGKK